MKLINGVLCLIILTFSIGCTEPNSKSKAETNSETNKKETLRLVNRKIVKSEAPNAIHLNAQPGEGLAILPDQTITTGTIEIDILGENKPGESFVGIAFNIQNDSTFEVIYFRPFNFQAKEQIRREHSIQYVYHPEFMWRKLRTENEGEFEAEYFNPPNPDDWFKTRIVITDDEVSVIDPKTDKPLLKVKRLAESKSNKIAFWAGHGSTGGFKNLQISK